MKKSKPQKSKSAAGKMSAEDFLIVGIGASAGGIQALKEFFENVPADSGLAFVVILHLSPDHDSRLAEILQTVAPIPITQLKKREKVEPNRVYVVPPNKHLTMNDGTIEITPNLTTEDRRAPVDIFFRTLAESHTSRAVAVVLSGTGADGSMGLKRVKERGGICFVQNPRESEFSEMPRSAIATELVDRIFNVAEIPEHIVAYQKNLGTVIIPVDPQSRPEEQQKALREIFNILRLRTGHDFSNYKRPTILRRVERRINVRNLPDLPAYADFLLESPDEATALLKDLLISVTNFFRDKNAFNYLETEILPKIFDGKTAGEQVRIWAAGCATGEEAYSLAMLFAEQLSKLTDAPQVQIFASDIDERAIAAARDGFYTLNEAADVSPERLRHFFTKEQNGFRINRELRKMILFAPHNLLKDPPFSHLDLVTCRNLLIYLNTAAQVHVMETFHFALESGGFMLLGNSETIDGAGDLFASVSREHHIFQSRQVAPRITVPPADAGLRSFRFENTKVFKPTLNILPEQTEKHARLSYGELHLKLLEQYMPSVVVNEESEIVHLSESATQFLQLKGGELTKNLLELIRPEVRLELRAALLEAAQKRANITVNNLNVNGETINLHVRPVLEADDTARGFALILFEKSAEMSRTTEILAAAPEPLALRLEEELTRSKMQLRRSVEQFEAQTEELKASYEEDQVMNEELRSAMEELETSREELQSVNEELVTVNQELKIKVEELSVSNNDLSNLIASTDIGTVFLDRNLRVKMFTPPAREIFNFIPADLGRPLSDITNRLETGDLIGGAETVLQTLQAVEHEANLTDGRTFLLRISPYRTSGDHIGGIVITSLDITKLKQTAEALRESEERLRTLVENLPGSAVFVLNKDLHYVVAEGEALTKAGLVPKEFIEKTVFDALPAELAAVYEPNFRKTLSGKPFEIEHEADGHYYVSRGVPLIKGGEVNAVLAVSYDITARKLAEEKLRESEERLRLLIESTDDYAIFTTTNDGFINSWNIGAEKMFGWTESEAIGQSGAIVFTPEDRAKKAPAKERKIALQTGRAPDERFHIRKNGTRFFVSGVMTILKDTNNKLLGFVKIARDMTEQIEAEKALRHKEMLQKLVGALEDERRRIARDLHDELGQQLTALRLNVEKARRMCEDEDVCAEIDKIEVLAKSIDNGVDFLAWELRPAALDQLGLVAALENYVQQWTLYSGVPAELLTSSLKRRRFAREVETNLYRIAQEAMNNISKHAGAKSVEIILEKRGDLIVLIIQDDGKGFNVKDKKTRGKGIGLIGMEERAALIGGTLEIESAPGAGTTVFIRVPALSAKKGDSRGK